MSDALVRLQHLDCGHYSRTLPCSVCRDLEDSTPEKMEINRRAICDALVLMLWEEFNKAEK